MHAWLEVVAAGNSLQSCTARCTVSKTSSPPAPRQFCMHVGRENSLLDWDELLQLAFFGGAFLGEACIVALERKYLKHAASDSASKPSPSTDAIGICFDMCNCTNRITDGSSISTSRAPLCRENSPPARFLGPSIPLVRLDTDRYNAHAPLYVSVEPRTSHSLAVSRQRASHLHK